MAKTKTNKEKTEETVTEESLPVQEQAAPSNGWLPAVGGYEIRADHAVFSLAQKKYDYRSISEEQCDYLAGLETMDGIIRKK